jgi:phosphoribosylanthranilate isomerase
MFRVKVCGITSVADARAAADAGADAIGLNFFPPSPRYIELRRARHIVQTLPAGLLKVGVFVNSSIAEVCAAVDLLQLDLAQLHGDEAPEFISELGGRPVIRGFRLESGLGGIGNYLNRCRLLDCLPCMLLIDAFKKGEYGGTGECADWKLLAGARPEFGGLPVVLAGGLTPRNVAAAIEMVRPAAVDTASGVESRPGQKSPQLVRAFVAAAKQAFAQLV